MEGLRLIDVGTNLTITAQQERGKLVRNPFESPAFKAENRIVLDVTNMFDAPGPGSIRRSDVETLIPDVVKAHRMLRNGEGDIYDHDIPMTGWQDLPAQITESCLA
ncbi:MAG: Glucose-6-phosphate isomerase, partial [Thermodesulfobacteriota bacterium]|nr:Glucose-6-phosphate isomerase [Thermodesulfobacteriota bacterium]